MVVKANIPIIIDRKSVIARHRFSSLTRIEGEWFDDHPVRVRQMVGAVDALGFPFEATISAKRGWKTVRSYLSREGEWPPSVPVSSLLGGGEAEDLNLEIRFISRATILLGSVRDA